MIDMAISHRLQSSRPLSACLLARWAGMLTITLFVSLSSYSQAPLQTGLHYYMIENLDAGRVEQRGETGVGGIAFNNLFLAPETNYRVLVLQASTLLVAEARFTTPQSGETIEIPDLIFGTSVTPDIDGDGLHEEGELVMGTNADNPDSDADGVPDGPEVSQGLNPLSGIPARTGILGSADTPGRAVDICAVNDVVVIADSRSGVAVFNVFNGMNPVIIAQVDTPGTAVRISCSDNLVAVADGASGLTVIDINNPPTASVVGQYSIGGYANAVYASAGVAYVGLQQRQVVSVDMASGAILDRIEIPDPVRDLRLDNDVLYVLGDRTLYSIRLIDDDLSIAGSIESPFPARENSRLFIGDRIAYAVHSKGYNTIDISVPEQMALIQATNTQQFGWKQVVLNGSGLGIAAVSPNFAFDGPHHISLYDVSDPTLTDEFITEFTTPGVARAVTIYNGLAYVADNDAGMSVINYLQADALGVPPQIELRTNFAEGGIEEGKPVTLTAEVSDDVQVRNVEFYIDGRRVATDGNFPFEHRFIAPPLAQQSSIVIRARASDTGGNATWTDEQTLQILPDATPPRIVRIAPRSQAVLGRLLSLTVFFNEPIVESQLAAGGIMLFEAGPDGEQNTADDVIVPLASIEFREQLLAAFVSFDAALPPGDYKIVVGQGVSDLAGNVIVDPVESRFFIYDPTEDSDADCVPDALEPLLNLDPNNPDTNNNGVTDGDEDFDSDGLTNCDEVQLFTDPLNDDTDGDGVPDGQEDADIDGLFDGEEIALGTDPADEDSDDDSWPDGAERDGGSDPNDPASKPQLFIAARPPISSVLPGQGADAQSNFFIPARPPIVSILPGIEEGQGGREYLTAARPPVILVLPGGNQDGSGYSFGAYARPPVTIVLPGQEDMEFTTIAKPPVQIEWTEN